MLYVLMYKVLEFVLKRLLALVVFVRRQQRQQELKVALKRARELLKIVDENE